MKGLILAALVGASSSQHRSEQVSRLSQTLLKFQSAYGMQSGSVQFVWKSVMDIDAPKMQHWNKTLVVSRGDYFVPGDYQFIYPFPGFFVYTGGTFSPRDGDWVEVMHFYRLNMKRKKQDIPSVGQFWYYSAPGSGIWFNIGKAKRRNTVGKYSPGCERVIAQGFDSYILYADNSDLPPGQSHYGGMVEIVDCKAAQKDIRNLDILWQYACPHRDAAPLRRLGHDGNFHECRCNQSLTYLNCVQDGEL